MRYDYLRDDRISSVDSVSFVSLLLKERRGGASRAPGPAGVNRAPDSAVRPRSPREHTRSGRRGSKTQCSNFSFNAGST